MEGKVELMDGIDIVVGLPVWIVREHDFRICEGQIEATGVFACRTHGYVGGAWYAHNRLHASREDAIAVLRDIRTALMEKLGCVNEALWNSGQEVDDG